MNINCGFYSYANAPGLYDCIIGVTGTLDSMHPECVKIIIEKYKIN